MATASSSEVIGSVRGSITVGGETGSVTIPYPARALHLSFKRPSRTLAGVLCGEGGSVGRVLGSTEGTFTLGGGSGSGNGADDSNGLCFLGVPGGVIKSTTGTAGLCGAGGGGAAGLRGGLGAGGASFGSSLRRFACLNAVTYWFRLMSSRRRFISVC